MRARSFARGSFLLYYFAQQRARQMASFAAAGGPSKADLAAMMGSLAALTDGDAATAGAAPAPSAPSASPVAPASADAVAADTSGMLQIAEAMMQAQGPRPTFGDFGATPASNPWSASADSSSKTSTPTNDDDVAVTSVLRLRRPIYCMAPMVGQSDLPFRPPPAPNPGPRRRRGPRRGVRGRSARRRRGPRPVPV